jgi:predicted MFS family arabinose efflux permease
MSLWFFFATLGNIAGPILGSYIASTLGYEYAFYTSTGIVWAATIFFAATYLRQRDRQPPVIVKRRGLFAGFRELLKIGTLRLTCTITLLGFLGCAAVSSFLPIYAVEKIGMTTIAVGSMATVGATARLIATPLMRRLSDKVNKRKLLFAILAVGAALFALYPYAVDQWQLTLLTIGVSVSFSFGVLSIAIHSGAAPRELSGMSLGLYGTFEDIGLMVGSLVFGVAWGALGPSSVFTIAAAAAAAALAAVLALTLPEQKQ